MASTHRLSSRTRRSTRLAGLLLVAATTAACGGSGDSAPEAASTDDFCAAQSSLFTDLDLDFTDPDAALPTEEEMADAMHGWADRIAEVGTPEDIPDEAREGFEETVTAAQELTVEDLTSPDLDALESKMSDEAQAKVEAFSTYVSDTCGSVLPDDMPEMPEMPDNG